jgi:hypothetical protein
MISGWWGRDENHVGTIHNKYGQELRIYYRSRFPDDETYALISVENDEPRIVAFLWLGEMIDPFSEQAKYFWDQED